MTVVDNGVVIDLMLGRLRPTQLGLDELAAPCLIDAEFLHVMRRLNLRGYVHERQAEHIIERFADLGIERYSVLPLRRRVWQLRGNLTAYDASYVALAEALDSRLLTTDTRIARAAGIRCPVEVL